MRRAVLCALAYACAAGAQDIFSAAGQDSADGIRAALAQDPSGLNRRGPGGQTPLMYACLKGKALAVKALLDAGADTSLGEKCARAYRLRASPVPSARMTFQPPAGTGTRLCTELPSKDGALITHGLALFH